MLKKIEVANFKSFNEKISFDLSSSNYEFNNFAIKNGIVSKALVYGENGSGKSNLGLAVFDIIKSITTKQSPDKLYSPNYSCLSNKDKQVYFKYCFSFDKGDVEYEVVKSDFETFVYEKLTIDGTVALEAYRIENISHGIIPEKANKPMVMYTSLVGADTLNKKLMSDKLSIISYVRNNTNLDKRRNSTKLFNEFVNFVDHMLFFKFVDGNRYIGLKNGTGKISSGIIKSNNVKDLQNFLSRYGIHVNLRAENDSIISCFDEGEADFFEIASSGTGALTLFYYWYSQFQKENVSFLFIDEFDAFYHHALAVKLLKFLNTQKHIQIVLTSHNTTLISNELLRPDCYFVLQNNTIKSLPNLTTKEVRKIHNLEKMYKSNAFNLPNREENDSK